MAKLFFLHSILLDKMDVEVASIHVGIEAAMIVWYAFCVNTSQEASLAEIQW